MSVICNYIFENEDWEAKMAEKHITVTKKSNLVLFKYQQDADFFDPIVKEARGIIIDINKLVPVCWAFDKFGNYGESYADQIDWSTARVQEKVDGSIIKLWNYNGEWRLSTNGTIDAFETVNTEGYNFGVMTMWAFEQQGLSFKNLDPAYTYIFELVSPNNQIVVQYNKTEVYHIGTRRNYDGQEVNVDIGIQKPKEYALSSLDECIAFANTFKGSEHEGFVVVDAAWRRVKVKSEDWLHLHYMAGNGMLSISSALDLIMNNEQEEYLTYFPNKREKITKMENAIYKESLDIVEEICAFRDAGLPSRKEFAQKYHNHPHFSFYMKVLYDNHPLVIDKKYWLNFFKED